MSAQRGDIKEANPIRFMDSRPHGNHITIFHDARIGHGRSDSSTDCLAHGDRGGRNVVRLRITAPPRGVRLTRDLRVERRCPRQGSVQRRTRRGLNSRPRHRPIAARLQLLIQANRLGGRANLKARREVAGMIERFYCFEGLPYRQIALRLVRPYRISAPCNAVGITHFPPVQRHTLQTGPSVVGKFFNPRHLVKRQIAK